MMSTAADINGWWPIETCKDVYHPVLVWDEYHGMRVGRLDPLRHQWVADGPYDFEFGGKEINLNPTHWQLLPGLPAHLLEKQKMTLVDLFKGRPND